MDDAGHLSHRRLSHARGRSGDQMTTDAPQHQSTTSAHSRRFTYERAYRDGHDDFEQLRQVVGSRYASDELPSRGRLPASQPNLYSSAWSLPVERMSVNPAHEVTESLRSFDITNSEQSSMECSPPPGSEEEGEQEVNQQGMENQDRARNKMDSALPENDGMYDLRQKLHEIRMLAISMEEKAQRMHYLMMQDYMAQKSGSSSPSSMSEGYMRRVSEEPAALDVGLAALPIDASNPYNIRPGDLEPTYSTLPNTRSNDNDEGMEEDIAPVRGCMHYKRNVKVQCFDCHRWFPCRYCHDQSNDLPFSHNLRRKMTRNMLCMLCRTPQPAAEACVKCGEYAAWYFCGICKLWDNDSNKRIYHCDDCGICRLGEGLGKDYVHCKKCNVCISINTSAAHNCVERATEGPCPLCLDEMFASRAKVVSLPCGHYMHGDCYKDLMSVTYKCPVCSKSAVNMELQWRKLDDEIRAQPMPEDDEELEDVLPHVEGHGDADAPAPTLRQQRPRVVWIGCNDCGSRCWSPFHWLGLICANCDSYNTVQMAPRTGQETEAERLIRQQQVHRQHDFTGNAVLRDAGIGVEDTSTLNSPSGIPSSPSQLAVPASPSSPGSSTGSASSPRRYFVQPEEPRRPSFTTPRFSTPSLPTLSNLEMPRLPRMNMPNFPNMPSLPNMPNMNLPYPNWDLPNMPNMPNLELPRFSPYDMMDSLSRSLSPMRYYLQGLDIRDEQIRREANHSPTSIRSDPTADATVSKELTDPAAVGFWGSDGHFLSSEENDDSDESAHAVQKNDNDDDDDDDDSDSDSEDASDAEMVEDEPDGGADEWELLGHR